MTDTVGSRRASTPYELTRVGERISFVYLERCVVHRDDNAITAEDAQGVRHIPSATIGTLLLGPGTRVTHQAMSVLAESGAGVVWVGEQGVRFYSGGRSLNRSANLAEAQAVKWANRRSRLEVARAMYRIRFPGEDTDGMTRQELLGREGRRVKECYRREAARVGLTWDGRRYVPGSFEAGDAANQAVTAAVQCMYGIAQTTVNALGCVPALGFIHSGHELSFVLDIADLYKTDIAIPIAFEVAAEHRDDVGSRTRRAIRDQVNKTRLLRRCVDDIKSLLLPAATDDGPDQVTLHTDHDLHVPSGTNYADETPCEQAMTVLVLTRCPVGLRGFLTRWLIEISPGVFIGRPTTRIRQALWEEVQKYADTGRALLTYTTDNEQGFTFETHDHKWHPVDHEGLTLMLRPTTPPPPTSTVRPGWSNAAKRRRYGQR